MVTIREFEFIDHFIYLPHDGKWTDIMGTQLPVGQSEMNVPSGEPNSVTRLIQGSGVTKDIHLGLVSLNFPLEMDVG